MIEGCAHYFPLRVYFEDTDAGGIVYHASYLRFAERGRTEALRELGAPHQDLVDGHGLILVVRRIKVDYLTPARLDDLLHVATRLEQMGAATLAIAQRIEAPDGTVRAVLAVSLACLRCADLRPARVPLRWRDALTGLQAAGVGPARQDGG